MKDCKTMTNEELKSAVRFMKAAFDECNKRGEIIGNIYYGYSFELVAELKNRNMSFDEIING